jgi:hypothetical protein
MDMGKPIDRIITATCLVVCAFTSAHANKPTLVTDLQNAVILQHNGGWCWYQGPRAIVTTNNQLVFTTIAGDTYSESEAGDLWVTTWDLSTDRLTHVELHENGQLHNSDGSVVGAPGRAGTRPLQPRSFTEVFRGDADHVAWTVDLELDEAGHPYTVYSVQVDGAKGRGTRDPRFGQDHRYYFGRWDGKTWHVNEMAYAGTALYPQESDYTGLVALDPHDRNFVVISTNAHPQTGAPLDSKADGRRHWELFRGRTRDGGQSWTWTPITSDSTVDNLRPIIPEWAGQQRIILWTRGVLRSYNDYRLDVAAIKEPR